MSNFNKSHLNVTVKAKILKAICTVKRRGGVEHVHNKKGHAYLAVRIAPNGNILITDKKGRNIKNHLLSWKGAGHTKAFYNFIYDNLSNYSLPL